MIKIPDAPLYVRGDAAYLRRILNNLLTNALRYGLDGKEIGIGLREDPGLVWVDVWDRGKGILAQDLPHIFERLYTGEASRNTSLRGTGLGLTIAKNLVEKQGGRITVTSTPLYDACTGGSCAYLRYLVNFLHRILRQGGCPQWILIETVIEGWRER